MATILCVFLMMVAAVSSLDPSSAPDTPDPAITCYVCYNCLQYEEVQLRQCNATAGELFCLVRGAGLDDNIYIECECSFVISPR